MDLSAIPTTKDKFVDILTSLHIPDIFLDIVMRPRGVFKYLQSSVNDQPCEGIQSPLNGNPILIVRIVFILCIDSILQNHTAMCITYFPKSRQVYALYLGYSSRLDVSDMVARLVKNRDHTNNPFVLIAAFLETERKHRLKQIDEMVNIYSQKLQPQPGFLKQRTLSISKDGREMSESSQDFNSRLGTLKTQLTIWTSQLKKISAACDKFPEFKPRSTRGFLLDPRDYVNDMIETYEEGAMKCDNILQIMSLAFQKVLDTHSRMVADAHQT